MVFKILDKDGTKDLKNVLFYLNNPNSIKNASHKSRLSKKENRLEYISKGFKKLDDEQKKSLIEYIRDKTNIIEEFIEAFSNYQDLDKKEDISDFLYDLMIKTDEKKYRIKCFEQIFLNDEVSSLKIITELHSEEEKKEICKTCVSLNLERGYIYGLLNNVSDQMDDKLNIKKLLSEINNIQYFCDKPVLKIILENYKDVENLVKEINLELKAMNFNMLYTLSKDLILLDTYKFNVNKDEVLLLKWIIDKLDSNEGHSINEEIIKEGLSSYSNEWLIYLSQIFLKMDSKKKKLAVLILDYVTNKNEVTQDYSDKLAKIISENILESKEVRNDLLKILNKLNTTEGFNNVVGVIYNEGLAITKNRNYMNYIYEKIKETKEFKWLEKLYEANEYIDPKAKINSKLITIILKEKSPKDNYKILSMIKKYNSKLYSKIMMDFSEIITLKLDTDNKYIKLMIILDYNCENKNVSREIMQYNKEHLDTMKVFRKQLDPQLLEDYYIKEVATSIKKEDYTRVIEILNEIEDQKIKQNISFLLIEKLISSNFYELINIWEYLSLNLVNEAAFRDKLIYMYSNGEIKLTKESISFANNIGLDPVVLYKLIDDEEQEDYLMNIWYKSVQIGKITRVIKEKITSEDNDLNAIKHTQNLINKYGITDHSLIVLLKIKVYTLISIRLLEIQVENYEAPEMLDYISDNLGSHGLVDRFLADNILHNELDSKVVDYIVRKLMENNSSNDLLEYYWDNMLSIFNNGNNLPKDKMDIFFTHLTKSKDRIEWFLDNSSRKNVPYEMYMDILESLLILLNKYNRIILQIKQEKENNQEDILRNIGNSICNSLSNIEKIIISRFIDDRNDILFENIKKFRRSLMEVGIDTVEDVDNYGKAVKFDNSRHKSDELRDAGVGIVDSLGVSINNKNILLSTLLNID